MTSAHVLALIALGQWVMIGLPGGPLLGFSAWWRLDERGQWLLEQQGEVGVIRAEPLQRIDTGRYAYVPIAVTADWAPRGTYRLLTQKVKQANADAFAISAILVNKLGRARLHRRELAPGG